jgi:NTE family protein
MGGQSCVASDRWTNNRGNTMRKVRKQAGAHAEAAGDAPGTAAEAGGQGPIQLPPYETVALLLQGGGALGAYQCGVFQGLHEAGIQPTWLAGISIGALNSAIIAGNAPQDRVPRLIEFWETICQPAAGPSIPALIEHTLFNWHEEVRKSFTAYQAASALFNGQKGFFTPRLPPPIPALKSHPQEASYYDTTPLKVTLERLCDFDRINAKEMRVSVGAVNARTGNFSYFDNTKITLRPEHFMASGALPPGFAAVEIDGEHYWDGGLMSNTPLYEILQANPRKDTLAFQVDLWSASGRVPDSLHDVMGRVKDIQYSSRTRLVTELLQRTQRSRHMMRELLDKLPKDSEGEPWYRAAQEMACDKRYNIVHLIYHDKVYDGHYKDYQVGVTTMREHWQTGLQDIQRTLQHRDWLELPTNDLGFVTHDIHRGHR